MSPVPRNNVLIVLGMHRSGTSALTGMLAIAGADPGLSLLPAMQDVNPKGYWEHQDVVGIHDRLLGALNSSWDDERPLPVGWQHFPEVVGFRNELLAVLRRDFSSTPLWLLKDPRLCRLLPLWLELLAQLDVKPSFVLCLRHPLEVALSLERRDGIATERACLLWLEHFIESERATRGLPRLIVTYAQLLSDWHLVLQRIASQLGLPLAIDCDAARRIDAFLEPELRHHRHDSVGPVQQGRCCALAVKTYKLLSTVERLDSTSTACEAAGKEMIEIAEFIAPWSSEIRALKQRNTALEINARQLEAVNGQLEAANEMLLSEINRIKTTVSWQLTKPLRLIENLPRLIRNLVVSSKQNGL